MTLPLPVAMQEQIKLCNKLMVIVSEDSAEESCGEFNGRNNGLNSDSVICDARCWPQNKRDLLPIAFHINL